MSRYQKGESGNLNGRPVGSINKSNENVKNLILNFINENFCNVQSDFDKLKPRDKLKFLTDLLPYVTSKLKPSEGVDENYLEWPEEGLDEMFTLDDLKEK